jgi:hypothetical protein
MKSKSHPAPARWGVRDQQKLPQWPQVAPFPGTLGCLRLPGTRSCNPCITSRASSRHAGVSATVGLPGLNAGVVLLVAPRPGTLGCLRLAGRQVRTGVSTGVAPRPGTLGCLRPDPQAQGPGSHPPVAPRPGTLGCLRPPTVGDGDLIAGRRTSSRHAGVSATADRCLTARFSASSVAPRPGTLGYLRLGAVRTCQPAPKRRTSSRHAGVSATAPPTGAVWSARTSARASAPLRWEL